MASGIVTVLLVKYRGGMLERAHANVATLGRREGYLQLDVANAEDATTIADLVLEGLAVEAFQGELEVDPSAATPNTRPFWNVQLGEFVTIPTADLTATQTQRVVGVTMGLGADGTIQWIPEVGSGIDDREAMIARTLRRMLGGSLAGVVEAPTPTSADVRRAKRHNPPLDPAVFGLSGSVTATHSTRWYIRRPAKITLLTGSLDTASSSGSVTVDIVLNSAVVIGTVTLAATVTEAKTQVQYAVAAGDYIYALVTGTGTGAADLTVQVDITTESEPQE